MPDGATTGSLLGSVDIDNKGLGGLEAQYDKLLTGIPGELTLAENPQGRTIPVGEHQLVPARAGRGPRSCPSTGRCSTRPSRS